MRAKVFWIGGYIIGLLDLAKAQNLCFAIFMTQNP